MKLSIWMTATVCATALTLSLTPVMADEAPKGAAQIHADVITMDSHVDIPLNFATDAFDPGETDAPFSQVDLKRMEAGGLDAVFFVVFAAQNALDDTGYAESAETAFRRFAAIRRMTDRLYPDRIGLARTAADVRRLNAEGKKIALIGVENGYSMGENLALLDIFYDLGARYFGLVHNGHNQLADSSQPQERLQDQETKHNGLSDLGKAVVERCNDLGMMIDVSHASKGATLQAIELSRAPVIASHSASKAMLDHPRNMSDEELLALKENGGVVQVVAFRSYLRPVPAEKTEALQALREKYEVTSFSALRAMPIEKIRAYEAELKAINERMPGATVSDLVDHIDYIVKLIGINHVGISSDFQGGGGIGGWTEASETGNVTAELVARGYTAEQIEKIWGGNLLRVMEEVEAERKKAD